MKSLYIVSGRPCSGKTSMVYRLSQNHSLHPEYLDVFAASVVDKSDESTPEIFRWKGWDLVKILNKEPEVLFHEYIGYYEELMPMVLQYLKNHEENTIILESSFFLPEHIKRLSIEFNVNSIFMKTLDEFVRKEYVKRDYAIALAEQEGGSKSLENLLNRDVLFAKHMYNQAEKEGFEILDIKGADDFNRAYDYLSEKWFKR